MNAFDRLTQEAIDKIASDNINEGVEALEGICEFFAKAGLSKEEFEGWRIYIINMATMKARDNGIPSNFIEEKVKLAERARRNDRAGRESRIIVGV